MLNGRMRFLSVGAAAVVLLALAGSRLERQAGGQTSGPQQPQHTPQQMNLPGDDVNRGLNGTSDPLAGRMEAMRAKALQDDRHKRLESDAEKLVQAANELKEAVDKTPKDQLSLIVVKKAADIEKFAHDIKVRETN